MDVGLSLTQNDGGTRSIGGCVPLPLNALPTFSSGITIGIVAVVFVMLWRQHRQIHLLAFGASFAGIAVVLILLAIEQATTRLAWRPAVADFFFIAAAVFLIAGCTGLSGRPVPWKALLGGALGLYAIVRVVAATGTPGVAYVPALACVAYGWIAYAFLSRPAAAGSRVLGSLFIVRMVINLPWLWAFPIGLSTFIHAADQIMIVTIGWALVTTELARMKQQAAAADARQIELQSQHLAAESERLRLLQQLVGVQEQERLRIARELHDQMGQNLIGLSLGLRALEPSVGDAQGREALRKLNALASEIGADIHRIAREMRPGALDDIGFLRAMESYVDDWSARSGITIDFLASDADRLRIAPAVETTVFRLVQEALNNVAKHAGANLVSVVLEQRGDQLQIVIEDDGKGFDPDAAANSGRLGLLGMRERIALVGGGLTIDSGSRGGTTLYIRIPLAVKDGADLEDTA